METMQLELDLGIEREIKVEEMTMSSIIEETKVQLREVKQEARAKLQGMLGLTDLTFSVTETEIGICILLDFREKESYSFFNSLKKELEREPLFRKNAPTVAKDLEECLTEEDINEFYRRIKTIYGYGEELFIYLKLFKVTPLPY